MTQRTLVILRHAKADRPSGVADAERPLTERGHADAGAAGAWLAARGYRPDLVICSPAKRTRQTWHGVALALGAGTAPTVRYEPRVYRSGHLDLIKLLRSTEPDVGTVLIIGHYPTMSLLSAALDEKAGRDSDGLRTSGLAVHVYDGKWEDLAWGAPLVAAYTARA